MMDKIEWQVIVFMVILCGSGARIINIDKSSNFDSEIDDVLLFC
jgi:hypothetical protein